MIDNRNVEKVNENKIRGKHKELKGNKESTHENK